MGDKVTQHVTDRDAVILVREAFDREDGTRVQESWCAILVNTYIATQRETIPDALRALASTIELEERYRRDHPNVEPIRPAPQRVRDKLLIVAGRDRELELLKAVEKAARAIEIDSRGRPSEQLWTQWLALFNSLQDIDMWRKKK